VAEQQSLPEATLTVRRWPDARIEHRARKRSHGVFRHWAQQLGVRDLLLLAAVEQVGPLGDALRQYFKGQGAAEKV